ncbi:30S ribosomal protein S12 methylthiotransferase RimO [Anaerosphaera multitolerans]|uniref:Ribosomal protein uS12 methylthiotransferase RimO n=1 Tax=Anaerosphaera multitolerans TaxID=2487351 RepID=A0A437S5I3_9FIRM|nr:30S ribosomal protein S12 methylthiotransferase RimO [Anaerosphaera multitolerans]RVU54166.1 30S ribosomal protein S12 methylthiotransferase RimO [Anaerosphaera multitolerans]
MNSVFFITLGCSKNDVDTSLMGSVLDNKKYYVADNVLEANIIIINTCGFIDAAKEESIDTIFNTLKYKEHGNCKKIILAGCLAQRYSNELLEEIPEVDGIIGTGNISDLNEIIDSTLLDKKPIKIKNLNSDYLEGYRKKNILRTEYVKISEGCNNNCSYCIIPKLRGKNRSRKIEDIYNEVQYLVDNGTREVILIAQNTTDYGIDNYGEYKLRDLISKLSEINKLEWIRVMYLYPDNFTDELIEEFKTNDKLLKYVDIPLQHVSDNVLTKMNRKTNKSNIYRLIRKLRLEIPNLIIRTTFIVGFPGETEDDFNELIDFIEVNKFDKLGAFTYSHEEDTKAYFLENQISEEVKKSRLDKLMAVQQYISNDLLSEKIGKTFKALIEEKEDNNLYIARTYMDAPEIDGIVYINTDKFLDIGDFVTVKINESLDFDLIGELI